MLMANLAKKDYSINKNSNAAKENFAQNCL